MSFKLGETANTIDEQMTRFMPLIPLIGLLFGFFLPGFFIQLRPLTPWLIGLMTFSGALRLRVAEFGGVIKRPLPLLVFFVFARIIMPLYILFVSSFVFRGSPDTITGFVLLYATPTAASGFIWIVAYRGDKALGLTLILLDTALSPLIMPGTLSVLRGGNVTIDTGSIMVSMFFMVVLPTIIGVALNESSRGKIPAVISPYFNPLAKISMPVIIAANASLALPSIKFNDLQIWKIAGMSIFFLITAVILARLAAYLFRFDFERSVALTFPASQRNTSVTITIAVGFFPEAIALPALINILFQQILSGLAGRVLFRKGSNQVVL